MKQTLNYSQESGGAYVHGVSFRSIEEKLSGAIKGELRTVFINRLKRLFNVLRGKPEQMEVLEGWVKKIHDADRERDFRRKQEKLDECIEWIEDDTDLYVERYWRGEEMGVDEETPPIEVQLQENIREMREDVRRVCDAAQRHTTPARKNSPKIVHREERMNFLKPPKKG